MKIFKYPLQIATTQSVFMPEGAKILSIQTQFDQVCIWAMVDEDKRPTQRFFQIIGTGQGFDTNRKYLATVQQGSFVWHIFEIGVVWPQPNT